MTMLLVDIFAVTYIFIITLDCDPSIYIKNKQLTIKLPQAGPSGRKH